MGKRNTIFLIISLVRQNQASIRWAFMDRYAGKVAIVTGGAGGIGSAIARRLAKEGSVVVLFDLRAKDARRIATEIERDGGRAVAIGGSILSKADVAHCVKAALDEFGAIDVLVNNAATVFKANLAESSSRDWDQEMNGTLKGAFEMAQAVLPRMVDQGRGVVVNIGSVNALMYFGNPAYSAAKAGLISLTQAIAVEYGRYGIRANIVSPGTVRTQIATWAIRLKKDPKIFEKLARWYPVGRVGIPDDIASAVAYIASDEAAFVSGANLVIDGGVTAGMSILAEQVTLERNGTPVRPKKSNAKRRRK
jgi:NAD(P)-dependent dehydrogenase (short-subunit alcohol dehydrogenase family)